MKRYYSLSLAGALVALSEGLKKGLEETLYTTSCGSNNRYREELEIDSLKGDYRVKEIYDTRDGFHAYDVVFLRDIPPERLRLVE